MEGRSDEVLLIMLLGKDREWQAGSERYTVKHPACANVGGRG